MYAESETRRVIHVECLGVSSCTTISRKLSFAIIEKSNELLSGQRVLPTEQQSKIGETLPFIPWHAPEQRALPVDHLVVGER